jgi:apolipoprotein N-acyltransferase
MAVPAGRVRRLAAAGLAGLALHLAYPRPGWDLLGWVSLAPVLALAVTAGSPRRAFVEGWIAGCAFFIPLLRWLTHTMTTYSALTWPLAVLVLVLLAAYLALYWGAVAGLLAWFARTLGPRAVWAAPVVWVAAELLRTHLLSGFPWGLAGYIPYRRLDLIQLAAWTGVYGISALVVLVNSALAWVVMYRTMQAVAVAVTAGSLALGSAWLVGRGAGGTSTGETIRVALAQGNIDQAVKWNKAFQRETLEIYARLTREAAPGSRLVVWPEAAVPAYVRYEPWVLGWLTDLAAGVGIPLLVGAPDARTAGRASQFLNTAFLVDGQGIRGRYDKIHLVPFGEYVPLKRLLFFVEAIAADIGDFTPGRQAVVLPVDGTRFGTVICYEVIFPDLFRRFVAEGAGFMVNITNDAWFGESGGPLQHLQMVPLRAVENGVAVVRAANTGVSTFVSPSGGIGPVLPLSSRGVLRGDVPLRRGETFYTRFGDLFAYAMTAGAGLLVMARLLGRTR